LDVETGNCKVFRVKGLKFIENIVQKNFSYIPHYSESISFPHLTAKVVGIRRTPFEDEKINPVHARFARRNLVSHCGRSSV